ncbi:MAG: sulfite exporter TauE/SafE family protein, partial [Gammaproteobacteria bacterium]|nr:sulfite exporter TauE/SafE family protein [Gammaproteobacteria bacterium]
YIYAGWSVPNLPPQTFGYVHLTAFSFIIITSYLFAPLGARLAHHLPENSLRKGFALFLILVGLNMIFG